MFLKINYLMSNMLYIIINYLFIFLIFLLTDNQEFVLKTSLDKLIFNISLFIILLHVEIVNFLKKSQLRNKIIRRN